MSHSPHHTTTKHPRRAGVTPHLTEILNALRTAPSPGRKIESLLVDLESFQQALLSQMQELASTSAKTNLPIRLFFKQETTRPNRLRWYHAPSRKYLTFSTVVATLNTEKASLPFRKHIHHLNQQALLMTCFARCNAYVNEALVQVAHDLNASNQQLHTPLPLSPSISIS